MRYLALAGSCLLVSSLLAQEQSPAVTPLTSKAAFERFEQAEGGRWVVKWHPATGTPGTIYGTGLKIADWGRNSLEEGRRHANRLLAEHAAIGVDLLEAHLHAIAEVRSGGGAGARQFGDRTDLQFSQRGRRRQYQGDGSRPQQLLQHFHPPKVPDLRRSPPAAIRVLQIANMKRMRFNLPRNRSGRRPLSASLQPARTALCLLVEAIAAGGLVVVTNNQNSRMNGEIEMDVVGYESRPRNLQLAPFAFPAPVKSTEYLSAWWAEDLRTGPCSQPSVPAKHHPEL